MSKLVSPALIEAEIQSLGAFKEWLEAQGKNNVVGLARSSCGCPLWEFLSTQTEKKVEIASDGIAIGDGRMRHSRLSYEFMRRIDDGRSNNEPVEARHAIAALKYATESVLAR